MMSSSNLAKSTRLPGCTTTVRVVDVRIKKCWKIAGCLAHTLMRGLAAGVVGGCHLLTARLPQ